MKLSEIIASIEQLAPLALQESYDNAGLLLGSSSQEVNSALLTIDITEEVIDEAISLGAQLIIAHHPLVFSPLKKITGGNYIERCIIKAIQNSIAIYVAHTNLDAVIGGVNSKICSKIGLVNTKILQPKQQTLSKIITFVPLANSQEVLDAMFAAGAGHIGNYDSCSFSSEGNGSFRALENTNPYVGNIGNVHTEKENKIEVIVENYNISKVLSALTSSHPYEEPAIDIIPLANKHANIGSGMIGVLPEPMSKTDFLLRVKEIFGCAYIKYSDSQKSTISKVAVCGGSGSFLIKDAQRAGADIFLTGDVKYHDFFSVENQMIIADLGHYESEQYTKDIFYEILNKKFPTFALYFSKVITNPIQFI